MKNVVVAYLIQSHKNVSQVQRLVRALAALDSEGRIYVSHDAEDRSAVELLNNEHRTKAVLDRGERGQFSMILRWLRAVEQVRADGGADFVVLLSGQDYPVRRLTEMHQELQASGDGFLEHFPALIPEGNHWSPREGRTRYLYRWREFGTVSPAARERLHALQAINRVQPLVRVNVVYGKFRVGIRGNQIPQGLLCYGGSMFTSLSWRSVEYILDTVRERPDVMRWAGTSLNIDEAFFQSVLVSSGRFQFTPSSRRFYRFEDSRFGHPHELTADDVPAALESGAYFARKFETDVDSRALDLIDSALHIAL